MAQTFFLRRETASNYQYFYMFCEGIELVIDHQIIGPLLPGNDSTNLAGPNGTNFILDLGKQRIAFNVRGTITTMESAEFPTLSSTARHVLSNATTVSSTQSGRVVHNAFVNYVAAQSETSTYSAFKLGYPEWYDSGTGDSIHSTDTTTRLFEGAITNARTEKIAASPDQFDYSFTFVVGDV